MGFFTTNQSERNQHYHNKGQTDASDNKFDPPHGATAGLQGKKAVAEEKSYKEGHAHTKNQKK